MAYTPETPFDSLESAHQFVDLLLDAIQEAQQEVAEDLAQAQNNGAARRVQALLLVTHKLERLSFHISRSRRLLNDLRMLRRLLLEDSGSLPEGFTKAASGD